MKRPIAIAVVVVDFVIVVVLFYSDIKDFLSTHSWWQSFLATTPEIALAVLAWIESRHSGEANDLRSEANDLEAQRTWYCRNVAWPGRAVQGEAAVDADARAFAANRSAP